MGIFLRFVGPNSNKVYLIENESGQLVARYGRNNKTLHTAPKGVYSDGEALKLLRSKLAKGYEIESVHSKPFSGTDIQAIQALSSGNFSSVTPQAVNLKAEVPLNEFVFNEDVISPIW